MCKRGIFIFGIIFLILTISSISGAGDSFVMRDGLIEKEFAAGPGEKAGLIKEFLEQPDLYEGDKRIEITEGDKVKILNEQDITKIKEGDISVLKSPEVDSYIIEFKEPSVLEKNKILKKEIKEIREGQKELEARGAVSAARAAEKKIKRKEKDREDELADHKNKLKSEHASALRDIERIMREDELASLSPFGRVVDWVRRLFGLTGLAVYDKEVKIKREFYDSFNGIVLKLSEKDAEKIKKSGYVKGVYPDLEVKASLMDSVPLINADDVWQLDEDGDNCTEIGKTCLTGENMTIAIIDTGIDYLHSDFGGEFYEELERNFTKINKESLDVFDEQYDQMFAMDGNRIAYYSGNQVFVHNFDTNETTEILLSNITEIIRLDFKDNLIAYFGSREPFNAGVYVYNLDTQENRNIVESIYDVGYIFVSNGKVIFDTNLALGLEIFIYDYLTENTTVVSEESYIMMPDPVVGGNLIAYALTQGGEDWYGGGAIIYNIDTGEKKHIEPPNLGPILDIKDGKILYIGLDPEWKTYYLYDINTGNYTILEYPETGNGGEGSQEVKSFLLIPWTRNKGRIGEDVVFFSKDDTSKQMIAYDLNLGRYVKINLYTPSGAIDAEGKKICFLSGGDLLCHDYNPNYDYPLPESAFSEKIIGGYDFVNNDEDPMDDHGHGTHCAGIAAAEGNYTPAPEVLPNKISFYYSGNQVFIDVEKEVWDINFVVLYGNGTDFTGFGEDETNRLVTSNTTTLLFDRDTDRYFVASWFEPFSESYLLGVSEINEVGGINYTTIEDISTGQTVCEDKTVGETCAFGDIILAIEEINNNEQTVELSINTGGSFQVVVDENDNLVFLPLSNEFPVSNYEFEIYDNFGEIIETHMFSWIDGSIIHDISGGGGSPIGESNGLKGVAPKAKLYAYKVLDAWGSGWSSDIIAAIERSADPNQDGNFSDHIDVISLSLGFGCKEYYGEYNDYCGPDDSMSRAIDNVVSLGVVASIAACNDGKLGFSSIGSPGTARKAITVGATDKYDVIASFSSKGPVDWEDSQGNKKYLIKPEVVAPGRFICSAQWDGAWESSKCLDDRHVAISGTSMATPHVAGAAALLKQAHPDWSPEKIKSQLQNTAQDIETGETDFLKKLLTQGHGRIDVLGAVTRETPLLELSLEIDKVSGILNLTAFIEGTNLKNYSISYKQTEGEWKELVSSSDFNNLQHLFEADRLDSGEIILRLEVYNNNEEVFHKEAMTYIENILLSVSNEHGYLIEPYEKIYAEVSFGSYVSYEIYFSDGSHEILVYSSSKPLVSGEIAEIDTDSVDDGRYNLIVKAEQKSGEIISSAPLEVIVFKAARGGMIGVSEFLGPYYLSIDELEGGKSIVFLTEEWIPLGGGWYRVYNDIEIWKNDSRDELIDRNSKLWKNSQEYEVLNTMGYGIYKEGKDYLIVEDAWREVDGENKTYGNRMGIVGDDLNYLYLWPSNIQDTYFHHGDDYSRVFDSKIYSLYEWDNWSLYYVNYSAFFESRVFKIIVHDKYGELVSSLSFKQFDIEESPEDYSYYLSPKIFFIDEDPSKVGVVYSGHIEYDYRGEEKDVKWLDFMVFDVKAEQRVVYKRLYGNEISSIDRMRSVVSGDIDNDNQTEIIIGYRDFNRTLYEIDMNDPEVYHASFLILDSQGIQKYPLISFPGYSMYTGEAIITEQDGKRYIAAPLSGTYIVNSEDKIVVFDAQGNIVTNLSVDYEDVVSEIISGDIDNDNITELIYTTSPRFWTEGGNSYLRIVDMNGSLEKEIEFYPREQVEWLSQAALSDYNQDGKLDLSVLGYSSGGTIESETTTIYNLDLGYDYHPEKLYWPVKWHDAQRTSCYRCGEGGLSSYLEIDSLIRVGEVSQIKVKIENDYASEKNVNYSVNSSLCEFENRETCVYNLIGSGSISVEGYSYYNTSIDFSSSIEGEYVLKLEVTEENKPLRTDYYSVTALEFFADLYLGLGVSSLFVNETSEIIVYIDNIGNEDSDAQISLYYEKGDCSESSSCDNLTLIETKQAIIKKRRFERIGFTWTPNEEGDFTLVLRVNASNNLNPITEEKIFVRVKGNGADLSGWLNAHDLTVNEPNTIEVHIYNNGNRRTENGSFSFYYQYGYCYEFAECLNLSLIGSGELDLEEFSYKKENFNFTPTEEGAIALVLVLNASNEIYPDNNINYDNTDVREAGPDPFAYFSWENWERDFFINETGEVSLGVINDGTETATDINISLYEEISPEEYSFIGSMLIDELEVDREEEINISWIPRYASHRQLKANISSDLDVNEENNQAYFDAYVRQHGPDLEIDTMEFPVFVRGEERNITVGVYNVGDSKVENVSVSVYHALGYCEMVAEPGSECCDFEFLEKRNLPDINESELEIFNFSLTLNETGYNTLKFTVNLSEDVNLENNELFRFFEVKEPGPDPRVYFSWRNWEREFILREENIVTLIVENDGTETATNINLSLYEEVSPGEYSIIGSELIDSLDVYEGVEMDIPWIPTEAGYRQLKANISSDLDVNEENNENGWEVFIIKNETDVSVNRLDIYQTPVVGREIWIAVELLNLGIDTGNITLSVYDNGSLIERRLIENIFSRWGWGENFWWTPTEKGNHTIRAEINLLGDTEPANDYLEKEVYVYSGVPVTFTITDSQNNLVGRHFDSEHARGEQYINGTGTVLLPNLSETNSRFLWGLIKLDSHEEGVMTGFNTSFKENLTIISEFYNRTTENTDYYSVFANKVSAETTDNWFALARSFDYLRGIGINTNLLEDYDVFYCRNFSFSGKSCEDVWKKAEIEFFRYEKEERLHVEAYSTEPAEAFALSESRGFDGNTTNLTEISLEDIIYELIIEKRLHGRAKFKGEINITRLRDNPELLQEYVKIKARKIMVDTGNLTELMNLPAQLLFRNIFYKNPQLLYNRDKCPASICSNITYNETDDTFTAEVANFSEFEIVEGPYCGDGTCQPGEGETCSNCVADCGACPQSPGDNGGSNGRNGAGVSSLCTPKWNCTWGPCQAGVQNLVCVDLEHCGNTIGKPADDSRMCFIEADCIDNDGDGYGVGPDCLGPDVNDNDPGVTTERITLGQDIETSLEKLKERIVKYKYYLIGLVSVAVAAVIFLLLRRYLKERKAEAVKSVSSKQKKVSLKKDVLMKEAKEFMKKINKKESGEIKEKTKEKKGKDKEKTKKIEK